MTTYAGEYGPSQVINTDGSPLKNLSISVFVHGTTTLAVLYTSRTKSSTVVNPTTTDAEGNLSFYTVPGRYDIAGNGGTLTVAVYDDPTEPTASSVFGRTGAIVATATDYKTVTLKLKKILLQSGGSVVTTTSVTIISPITVSSGSKFRPSSTLDTEIFLNVTTAGTLHMTYGVTPGTAHTLMNGAVAAGTCITKRIPAGWWVVITLTTAVISTVKVQSV